MGVLSLRAIFLVSPGTPWGTVTLGEVDRDATYHITLNSSSNLLVLALAVTAVIAGVVFYFAIRRRRRALLSEGQKAPVGTR